MKYIFLVIFGVASITLNAQTTFISSGKISFERKLGQHTLVESLKSDQNDGDFWIDEMKKMTPKVITDNFVLEFDANHSIYKLEKENADNKYMVGGFKPVESDYTFQNLNEEWIFLRKTIFENEYMVKDSLPKYQWKISGELRDIAGFECKKAVTKICDSVVVVAFYTDQIIVKSGPESFNGLPGMILGLAIPRLSESIYATKLELSNPIIPNPIPAKKIIKRSQVSAELNKGLAQWGKFGKVIVWAASL